MTESTVDTWWLGQTCDHVYEDCPNRMRGVAELQRTGWEGPGRGPLHVLGSDVCGMCVHRWKRKQAKETAA